MISNFCLNEMKEKALEKVVFDIVNDHFEKSLRQCGNYDDAWNDLFNMSIDECNKFIYLQMMKIDSVEIANLIGVLFDNCDIKRTVSTLMSYAMDGKYKRLNALGIINQEGEYVSISA